MKRLAGFVQYVYVMGYILLAAHALPAQAQFLVSPQPGEVYKEFTVIMNGSVLWRVLDPNASNPGAQSSLPNPVLSLTVSDLQHAVRAEAVIDQWNGHPGTTNKSFRFNNNAWISIPELVTTPTAGECFMRQSNPVIPVPLNHLVQGTNLLEGTAGPQTCFNFDWGQWGWYTLTLRVYYDPALKTHPTGSITSHNSGSTFGENPTVSANATGSAGISRVEFFAYYDGYDTDGDGRYLDYHHSYHRLKNESVMVPANHVGTDSSSPYSLTWNTDLVPDQTPGTIKMLARIRDNNGVWFVTNEVSNLTLQRLNSSVRLYQPENVQRRFWVRESRQNLSSTVTIPSGHNLGTATSAKLMVATWNGIDGSLDPGLTSFTKVNNWTTPKFGKDHFYSYDVLDVPPSALVNGTNTILFNSQSTHHGREILWPGPAILVRYGTSTPPGNQLPVASFTATPSTGTVPTTVNFNASGSTDPDGNITNYSWNFGDGTSDSGVSANHQYTAAGNYTVTLTVTDNQGATDDATTVVTISTAGGGGSPSGMVSDGFSGGILNSSVWSVVDPVGDSTVSPNGSGQLAITVPAGTSHDLWKNALQAPRVRQVSNNTDFQLEVKFDSSLGAQYQLQGLTVEQDATNLLRFDFTSNGTSTSVYSASFVNGVPNKRIQKTITAGVPLYLRVTRVGNQWTESYSYDGINWITAGSYSHTLNVTAVGVFAGNAGTPAPAHTALVDYFMVDNLPPPVGDNTPPVVSNIQASVTSNSATVSWNTDEASDSRVDYGATNAYGLTSNDAALVTSHSLTLNNLTPNTLYHYRVRSTDASGNAAQSADRTFTTASGGGNPSGMVSDEFSGGSLNSNVWNILDPVGDSTVSVNSGQLAISVPAGTSHDLWKNELLAPRVRQGANNTDFQLEVKFDSAIGAKYQVQGITVEQDATNLLRFDFTSNGTSTSVYSASFINGVPTKRIQKTITAGAPLYLRVTRVGNTWTESYSSDGITWTTAGSYSHTLNVTAAGVFAANAGAPAPAHTALVDYFRVN